MVALLQLLTTIKLAAARQTKQITVSRLIQSVFQDKKKVYLNSAQHHMQEIL